MNGMLACWLNYAFFVFVLNVKMFWRLLSYITFQYVAVYNDLYI